jgi:hypothetical protein
MVCSASQLFVEHRLEQSDPPRTLVLARADASLPGVDILLVAL